MFNDPKTVKVCLIFVSKNCYLFKKYKKNNKNNKNNVHTKYTFFQEESSVLKNGSQDQILEKGIKQSQISL